MIISVAGLQSVIGQNKWFLGTLLAFTGASAFERPLTYFHRTPPRHDSPESPTLIKNS